MAGEDRNVQNRDLCNASRRWEIWEIDSVLEQNYHDLRSHFDGAKSVEPYIGEIVARPDHFAKFSEWVNRSHRDVIKISPASATITGKPASSIYFSVAIKCAMPILVADNMIASYAWAWNQSKKERLAAGREIQGAKFGAICSSVGNNFRHHAGPEWRLGEQGDRQDTDVFSLLGVAKPWDRIVAADVWTALGYGDFEQYHSDIRCALISLRPKSKMIPADSDAYKQGFR